MIFLPTSRQWRAESRDKNIRQLVFCFLPSQRVFAGAGGLTFNQRGLRRAHSAESANLDTFAYKITENLRLTVLALLETWSNGTNSAGEKLRDLQEGKLRLQPSPRPAAAGAGQPHTFAVLIAPAVSCQLKPRVKT